MTKGSPAFQKFVHEDIQKHEYGSDKYTTMDYDESDTVQVLSTNIVKGGSLDDIFILEKVSVDELNPV